MITKLLRSSALALSVLLTVLMTGSAFLGFFIPNLAEAQSTGAAIVNVQSAVATGGTLQASGSASSGIVLCPGQTCGGGINGGGGPVCNCCNIPPRECADKPWKSCLITGINYTLSGPTPRSGSVTMGATTQSPAGCTTECSVPSNGDAPHCNASTPFTINTSGLAAGDYSLAVTTTDCRGSNTATRTFTVPVEALGASCEAAQSSYTTGTQVRWDAIAAGGTGNYTYSWSGTDSLSGTTNPVYKTYATAGTKTANITVTSGSDTKTVSCSVPVTAATPTVNVSCSASPSPQTNQPMTWTAYPSGGTGGTYTYSWTGNGSFPSGATTNPVTVTYTGTGVKNANVTVTSGGQTGTTTCSTYVDAPGTTTTIATINIHSDLNTTFSLSGPTPQSGSLTASTTRTFTGAAGTYTISPAAQPNCSASVSPASTQSAATGGTIAFNIHYTCTPPSGPLSCSATPSTASAYQSVAFTASGGSGGYTWTSVGGDPATGSGNPFTTSYSSNGNKNATVTSGSATAQCAAYIQTGSVSSVDIEANGSDGPLTIPSGSSVWLAWGTQAVNGCTASGSWSGAKTPWTYGQMDEPDKWESAGPLAAGSYTYTITCEKVGEPPVADSVTVNVTAACIGNINVTSNVGTTWALTGPSSQTQGTAATSHSYTGLSCGSYTITPAALAGYVAPNPLIVPASSQTLSSGGTLSYALTYSATPPAGVDIKANGSDNPASIVTGTSATLSWTTSDIQSGSCIASASPASSGWTKNKADSGSQDSAAINQQTTFTLACRNSANTADVSDSVIVSVRPAQCDDGADNDGDGDIDAADPGCQGDDDDDDDDNDDNDDGGGIDDNEGNSSPQCSDGIDNQDPEDTLADANDPGCVTNGSYDPTDTNEQNTGTVINACGDGFDNDGDGTIDEADSGCASGDGTEQSEPDIREI